MIISVRWMVEGKYGYFAAGDELVIETTMNSDLLGEFIDFTEGPINVVLADEIGIKVAYESGRSLFLPWSSIFVIG